MQEQETQGGEIREEGTGQETVSLTCGTAEARKGISKVGLTMSGATLIYWFVPVLLMGMVEYVNRAFMLRLDSGVKLMIRFLINYLIVMPLILFILKKLPETVLERRRIKVKQYLGILSAVFGIMIASNIVGLVIAFFVGLFAKVEIMDTSVIDFISGLDMSAAVVFVSIIGPVYEELIFRKMLVTRLVRYGEGVAIVLSGLMFGIFHGNWNQFVYAFTMGMFLAFIYVRTGDVRITISLHVIVNFSSSVILAGLMKWAHYSEFMALATGLQNGAATMEQLYAFVEQYLLPIICFYGFIFLEYGLALLGVILFLVFLKQMKLQERAYVATKGEKVKTMFLNVGMIAFFVLWAGYAILSLNI